jgi:hypothetical protein
MADTTLIEALNINIPTSDYNKISELAKEGKQISKIQLDYPQYDYNTIYFAVTESEQSSSLGIKRRITNRLKKLSIATKREDRESLAEEIDTLVNLLYSNYKSNFKKLQKIREALVVE